MPSFWSTATVGLIAATTAAGVAATHAPDFYRPPEAPRATLYLPVVKKPLPEIAAPVLKDPEASPDAEAPWVSEALKQARAVGGTAAMPPKAPKLADSAGDIPAAAETVSIAEVRQKPAKPSGAAPTASASAAKSAKASTAQPASDDLPVAQAAGKPATAKKKAPAAGSLAALRLAAKAPRDPDHAFRLSKDMRAAGAGPTEWTAMLEWAADRGHEDSIYRLGTIFRTGDGVPRDTRFARFWFEMGAAEGHVASIHNLGVMLVEGHGGPKEPDRGYRLIALAAENGFADSMKLVAELPAGQ
jgi:hypothetical protein